MSKSKEQYAISRRLHVTLGELAYSLEVFGDALAQREKYKSVGGMDAIHLYLIRKYHWLPRDVRSMSAEDMRFVLSEELEGWTLPKAARAAGDPS